MELWFWRKWALNTNTELDKFIRLRAYFLSKQAGDPPGHEKEFYYQAEKEIKEEGIYEKEAKLYKIVGSQNTKEALGFIKDWVTALVQIETAAIGAIGAFVSFKNFPHLTLGLYEWPFLVMTVLSFAISIVGAVFLLNSLPGAAQRLPVNRVAEQSDVFSIANGPTFRHLNAHSRLVRISFMVGVCSLAIFVAAQIFGVAVFGQKST